MLDELFERLKVVRVLGYYITIIYSSIIILLYSIIHYTPLPNHLFSIFLSHPNPPLPSSSFIQYLSGFIYVYLYSNIPSLPNNLIHSILVDTSIYLLIFHSQSHPLLISFYTCRDLHILTYTLSSSDLSSLIILICLRFKEYTSV